MDIRFALPENTEDIKQIWQYCFHDPLNYIDWFFKDIYKCENTLCAFEDGKIIAALQLFPRVINIAASPYNACYIAGVSVLPEFRCKGISAKLLVEANDIMRKRGYDIALLVPFNFTFYRKFGYNCIGYLSEYSGRIESLRPFANTSGTFSPYEKPPLAIYKKFMKSRHAFLPRVSSDFEEIYTDNKLSGGYFYVLNEGGYLIYKIEDNLFSVSEIAYTSTKNLQTLLGFIQCHSSQVTHFKITTASDGVLRTQLCEKDVVETRYPYIMAKILNKTVPSPGDGINKNNYFNMLGWI